VFSAPRTCQRSFPPVATFVFEVDILHRASLTNKGTDEQAHHAYYQGTEHGSPEPLDVKAGYDARYHLEHKGVYNEGKKAEGDDIYGKRQKDYNRPEKGVKYAQHGRGEKSRKEAACAYAIQKIGSGYYSTCQD
jgi:hypothetical protein